MKYLNILIGLISILNLPNIHAQQIETDSSQNRTFTLQEVVISVNKAIETKKNVAQQVQVMNAGEITSLQAQSTADLLAMSGNLFVQKSQLGGGSPVIRGFEASRILLVIDGIRMNNIIYRGGHLQNIVTTDNNSLDRLEILYGPSSNIYGSDALGGVVHLYTKQPLLATSGTKSNIRVNASTRYGSADKESTSHLDLNIGGRLFGSLTSLTFSKFGDLRGGASLNPFYKQSYGERPFYVETYHGIDSLVVNSDPYVQTQSRYAQYDLLQKFLYQPNEHLSHGVNIQFSNSTNVPRYDRLTDPKGDGLNSAEWYYGPQKRLLAAYDLNFRNPDGIFQGIHFGINFQDIEESRHNRNFNSTKLNHRIENVQVYGLNLDFQRTVNLHKIRFGIDGQYNTLTSTANAENISTGEITPLSTRYPDGDNIMLNAALYFSHTWDLADHLTLVDGFRAGYVTLHSTFVDNTFFEFPYTEANQKNPVFSGNIGLIESPSDDWKISLLVSTAFRAPNVDDLSKVFETAPGAVIVPNPDLKPERTINTELGITKIFGKKISWENNVYYTLFRDAIVTDLFQYNNQDSIFYDDTWSLVLANQNKREAYLYGFSSQLKFYLGSHFQLKAGVNYTYGRIKTSAGETPLDHIPPFMARLSFAYKSQKIGADFFVNYNGWKKLKDYYLNGEDNEQYATADGMPAWFTANIRASYQIHHLLTIQAGVDNILDTQYRAFASGINAPGRNIFATLRFHY